MDIVRTPEFHFSSIVRIFPSKYPWRLAFAISTLRMLSYSLDLHSSRLRVLMLDTTESQTKSKLKPRKVDFGLCITLTAKRVEAEDKGIVPSHYAMNCQWPWDHLSLLSWSGDWSHVCNLANTAAFCHCTHSLSVRNYAVQSAVGRPHICVVILHIDFATPCCSSLMKHALAVQIAWLSLESAALVNVELWLILICMRW